MHKTCLHRGGGAALSIMRCWGSARLSLEAEFWKTLYIPSVPQCDVDKDIPLSLEVSFRALSNPQIPHMSLQKLRLLRGMHTPPFTKKTFAFMFCLPGETVENKCSMKDSRAVLFIPIKAWEGKTIIHNNTWESCQEFSKVELWPQMKSSTTQTNLCFWPSSEQLNDCHNIVYDRD